MTTKRMSTRNSAFQLFESLRRSREKRAQKKLFFLEGVHPIEQAVGKGWRFGAIGYAADTRLSGWARDMIDRAAPSEVYEISPALMAELSDREQPCELIALAGRRESEISDMCGSENPLIVLFDRPHSPGNLGTVIRSADAFGASGILTTGHSADFYDPQCIRASVGSLFALPFCALESQGEALTRLRELHPDIRVVASSARGGRPPNDIDLAGPTLLLIGNETFGLSKGWKQAADDLTTIPISGAASSLNAGSAASILLYEAARQRAERLNPPR